MITLECKHQVCFDCGKKWLIEKGTCPLCRNTSEYFFRNTRNQKRADSILFCMNLEAQLREYYHIDEYCKFLDFYILKNKQVWYKPYMNLHLNKISSVLEKIKNENDIFDCISDQEKIIINNVLELNKKICI
jgi:hypothetical protein